MNPDSFNKLATTMNLSRHPAWPKRGACRWLSSYTRSRPLRSPSGGTNLDLSVTTPKKRTKVRHPIIINGAGPASLMLAMGLQRANIL